MEKVIEVTTGYDPVIPMQHFHVPNITGLQLMSSRFCNVTRFSFLQMDTFLLYDILYREEHLFLNKSHNNTHPILRG